MFVIFILAGFGQSWFPFLLCRHAKTKLEEGEEEGPGREKRSANCLRNADINKIYQLVSKTEAEMLKTKNFGRKSLNEIKEVLTEMGLTLGMKLEGFVPPEEDNEEGE